MGKLKRRVKYYLIRLLRLKASPHQVAMGLALGFAPNWVPTFGMGPLCSAGIAKLARVNVFAAFIGGVIGTPLWPIFFWWNYQVASLFFNNPTVIEEIEDVEYIEAVNHTVNSLQSGGMLFLKGAIINMLASGVIIYVLVYFLFKRYRLTFLRKLK